MNTTDLEIMSETPSQPARITRRTFVKRTGATAIVTVLALHAFRNEAMAADNAGSYSIKLESLTPPPVSPETQVKATTIISSTEDLKVFIFGKDTNYRTIVGDSQKDTQAVWEIDVEVLAWKVTNNAMRKQTLPATGRGFIFRHAFNEAMSMTKRYFTSLLSTRS